MRIIISEECWKCTFSCLIHSYMPLRLCLDFNIFKYISSLIQAINEQLKSSVNEQYQLYPLTPEVYCAVIELTDFVVFVPVLSFTKFHCLERKLRFSVIRTWALDFQKWRCLWLRLWEFIAARVRITSPGLQRLWQEVCVMTTVWPEEAGCGLLLVHFKTWCKSASDCIGRWTDHEDTDTLRTL